MGPQPLELSSIFTNNEVYYGAQGMVKGIDGYVYLFGKSHVGQFDAGLMLARAGPGDVGNRNKVTTTFFQVHIDADHSPYSINIGTARPGFLPCHHLLMAQQVSSVPTTGVLEIFSGPTITTNG